MPARSPPRGRPACGRPAAAGGRGVRVLAAMLAGAAWVAVPVWLKLRFGVLEVISTLLLNFVRVAGELDGRARCRSRRHLSTERSDRRGGSAPRAAGDALHAVSAIALGAAVALWYVFARTLWGSRLRAVGAGPRAAEISGRIDARRMAAVALLARARLRAGGRNRDRRRLLRPVQNPLRGTASRHRGGAAGAAASSGGGGDGTPVRRARGGCRRDAARRGVPRWPSTSWRRW